jgi:hypothetical protein
MRRLFNILDRLEERIAPVLCYFGLHALKDDGSDLLGRARVRCHWCSYRHVDR